jgi:hypothetical protein
MRALLRPISPSEAPARQPGRHVVGLGISGQHGLLFVLCQIGRVVEERWRGYDRTFGMSAISRTALPERACQL